MTEKHDAKSSAMSILRAEFEGAFELALKPGLYPTDKPRSAESHAEFGAMRLFPNLTAAISIVNKSTRLGKE